MRFGRDCGRLWDLRSAGARLKSIALAIVAEIHAFLHGSEGGPFTGSNG